MQFKIRAADPQGNQRDYFIDAPTRPEAEEVLRRGGLQILAPEQIRDELPTWFWPLLITCGAFLFVFGLSIYFSVRLDFEAIATAGLRGGIIVLVVTCLRAKWRIIPISAIVGAVVVPGLTNAVLNISEGTCFGLMGLGAAIGGAIGYLIYRPQKTQKTDKSNF